MPPKICFLLICFNDDYVLRECLDAAQQFGTVVAAEGPVAYWQRQGYERSQDETLSILSDYGVRLISGQWEEKDQMTTAAARLIPADTDFVWVLDADEIWQPQDIAAIISRLAQGDVDSVGFHFKSFYGGFTHMMTGFEYDYEVHRIQRWQAGAQWATHRPPTVLAPDGRPWREHRHISADQTAAMGAFGFHYSYIWPRQMQRKAAYYHDRDPGGTIKNYFSDVYLPWVLGDDDKKQEIEDRFDGVHNWLPQRRGPCRTIPFLGDHPSAIEKRLPRLKARFEREISPYRNRI